MVISFNGDGHIDYVLASQLEGGRPIYKGAANVILGKPGSTSLPVDLMERDLNRQLKVPAFEGSAVKGTGVGIVLKACLKETLKALDHQSRIIFCVNLFY